MKLYVASSWRNVHQPRVVEFVRALGYEAYDFRNPAQDLCGFAWSEVDPAWKTWTYDEYVYHLMHHPRAKEAFKADADACRDADACLLVMPSGRSAHLEAGFAVGAGKPLIIYMPDGLEEAELMYRWADYICSTEAQLHIALGATENGLNSRILNRVRSRVESP